MAIVTNYAITGVNPALSIWQFKNNGVGDFELPKGCCNDNWSIPSYVLRE